MMQILSRLWYNHKAHKYGFVSYKDYLDEVNNLVLHKDWAGVVLLTASLHLIGDDAAELETRE